MCFDPGNINRCTSLPVTMWTMFIISSNKESPGTHSRTVPVSPGNLSRLIVLRSCHCQSKQNEQSLHPLDRGMQHCQAKSSRSRLSKSWLVLLHSSTFRHFMFVLLKILTDHFTDNGLLTWRVPFYIRSVKLQPHECVRYQAIRKLFSALTQVHQQPCCLSEPDTSSSSCC